MMVPVASIVLIWQVMFSYNGALNTYMGWFGIDKIDWMKSDWSRLVILILFLWKNLGYNMVLFISAISAVPQEQLESAKMDGANSVRRFFSIKLPYLWPTIFFVGIMSLINSFKIFRGGVHMNKFVRNIMATALATSMILPLTGCNKSKKNEKRVKQEVVKEDDPYFTVKKAPLDFPVQSDKEVEYKEIHSPTIAGNTIVANYMVNYKMPDSVLEELNKLDFDADSDDPCKKYNEISEQYYESGTLYFDFDGNLIKKEASGDGESVAAIYSQPDGSYLQAITEYTPGDCKTKTKLRHCDASGNMIKEIPLEGIEDMWNAHLFVLENGNLLIGSGSTVYLVNESGAKLNSKEIKDFHGTMVFSDGKYYVYCEEFNEQTFESKSTYQEIDPNSLELKGDPKEDNMALWGLIQGSDGCYTMTSSGIKSIDILNGEGEYILDWNWVDYNNDNITQENMLIKSSDEIVLFESCWELGQPS